MVHPNMYSALSAFFLREVLMVRYWANTTPFMVLPPAFCQERIDGRFGSSACGVIAVYHAANILLDLRLLTAALTPDVVNEYVRSI